MLGQNGRACARRSAFGDVIVFGAVFVPGPALANGEAGRDTAREEAGMFAHAHRARFLRETEGRELALGGEGRGAGERGKKKREEKQKRLNQKREWGGDKKEENGKGDMEVGRELAGEGEMCIA